MLSISPARLEASLVPEIVQSLSIWFWINEWMNIWLLIPSLVGQMMLWYLTNYAQPPGFPFVSPDCRLKYLCSWPVSILTSENQLLMSSPQATYQNFDPLPYYFILERVNCIFLLPLKLQWCHLNVLMIQGTGEELIFFVSMPTMKLWKKNVFPLKYSWKLWLT